MDTPTFTTPSEALEWVHKTLGSILDHNPTLDGDRQIGMRSRIRELRRHLKRLQENQY